MRATASIQIPFTALFFNDVTEWQARWTQNSEIIDFI
jgi:hypothetical protein